MNLTILYTLIGYHEIRTSSGRSGRCLHVNEGVVTYCYSRSVPSQMNCEKSCTSQTSCIGYSHSSYYSVCFVIPSDNNCPSNFTLSQRRHTATTANDLVVQANDLVVQSFVCYGKNPGKINKLQMSFIYFYSHINPKIPLIYAHNNISR